MPSRRAVLRSVLGVFAGLAAGQTAYAGPDTSTTAASLIQVDPNNVRVQSFEGFGCSLCWWANQFGNHPQAETLADLIFSLKPIEWNGASVPGLGMQVARYNVGGGGGGVSVNGEWEKTSGNMPGYKALQSFWLNWFSQDPTSASWDWSRDANQRAILAMAVARGVNRVELFSNAPPWWMDYNHSTAGSDGGGDNLQSWNHEAFAIYLATVAKRVLEQWHVPVTSVEPFNEPSAGWWRYPQGQEGCHFNRETQGIVLRHLRAHLDQRGLDKVRIAASDENSIDTAIATWNGLDGFVRAVVGQVNAHGYSGLSPYRGGGRRPLHDSVRHGGKKLWMSEYGDPDTSGRSLADQLLLDLRDLQPDAWVYWQPLDGSNWGLIDADLGGNSIGNATAKYYVLAQFARHLRQGCRLLRTTDAQALVAHHPGTQTLALIGVSGAAPAQFRFDLSRFGQVTGGVKGWLTELSGDAQAAKYRSLQDLTVARDQSVTLQLPANAVGTLELDGVTI